MPTTNLTYSSANKCWVKSLGYYYTDEGKRVPKYFRFPYENSSAGQKKAQDELLPLLVQWQKIKARAKARGEKLPVWHNPKLTAPTRPLGQSSGLVEVALARRANESANPVRNLRSMSIADAKEAYCDWYETSGVGTTTAKNQKDACTYGLSIIDTDSPMIGFSRIEIETIIRTNLALVKAGTRRARTAKNYCTAVRQFLEWYAKQVEEFQLPKDFKSLFVFSKFKDRDSDDNLNEDGEEQDFEVYSNSDLKVLFECCSTDRQRLIILLGLQAGCYFVDIAKALKTKNIYLDRKVPFLLYKRKKESHHKPIVQKVFLWSETQKLLAKEMNRRSEITYAFFDETGKRPWSEDAIRSAWRRVWRKAKKILVHRKTVRHKDLRKTGATVITNLKSSELGELFLGHKLPGMGKFYIKIAKKRLRSPMNKWYEQLKQAKVFDCFPKDEKSDSEND